MSPDGVGAFLAMGGYGTYVWGSYGAFALVVAANVVLALRRARRVRTQLERELRCRRTAG